MLSWDTGLGKGWAAFLWPLLKVGYQQSASPQPSTFNLQPSAPVLLIAPGDLHQQLCEEAMNHFRIPVTILDSQEKFQSLVQGVTPEGRPILPPGFYLTGYTQLTGNGVQKMPNPDKFDPAGLLELLGLGKWEANHHLHTFFNRRAQIWASEYRLLGVEPWMTFATMTDRYTDAMVALRGDDDFVANQKRRLHRAFQILSMLMCDVEHPTVDDLSAVQKRWVARRFLEDYMDACSAGVGTADRKSTRLNSSHT